MSTQTPHVAPSRDQGETNAFYLDSQIQITAQTRTDPIPGLTSSTSSHTIAVSINYYSTTDQAVTVAAHAIRARFGNTKAPNYGSYQLAWDDGAFMTDQAILNIQSGAATLTANSTGPGCVLKHRLTLSLPGGLSFAPKDASPIIIELASVPPLAVLQFGQTPFAQSQNLTGYITAV